MSRDPIPSRKTPAPKGGSFTNNSGRKGRGLQRPMKRLSLKPPTEPRPTRQDQQGPLWNVPQQLKALCCSLLGLQVKFLQDIIRIFGQVYKGIKPKKRKKKEKRKNIQEAKLRPCRRRRKGTLEDISKGLSKERMFSVDQGQSEVPIPQQMCSLTLKAMGNCSLEKDDKNSVTGHKSQWR